MSFSSSFNMPPGCFVSDIPGWDDPDPLLRPHCECCGRFLTVNPQATVELCNIRHCDGKAHVIECSYNDGTHEGILDIIGDEYRDKTYLYAYAPACNSKDGNPNGEAEEIKAEDAESYTHAPHFFEDYGGIGAIRVCKHCGHLNREWDW